MLLTVLLALAAVGCSPDGEPGRGPAALDIRPLSGATAYSHADAVRLHDREEDAIAVCMTSRDFAYAKQPRTTSARSEETNPYGLLTPEKAAADGYGIVGEFLHLKSAPSPVEEPREPAWQQALTGTPKHRVTMRLPDGVSLEYATDGCVARARAETYGSEWNTVEPYTVGLANRVIAAVEANPGYRAAIRRWSSCMTRAGHRAANLQAPRTALNSRLPKAAKSPAALRTLGRDEIRLANADARCQVETGLAGAVEVVQQTVEQRLLTADDRRTIARYTTDKHKALAAADR